MRSSGSAASRPSERDAQPLPGGQAVGRAIEVVAQSDALERRDRARSGVSSAVHAADREAELHVLARGQERDEIADLVDDADARRPEPGEAVAVEGRQVGAERDDATRRSAGPGR